MRVGREQQLHIRSEMRLRQMIQIIMIQKQVFQKQQEVISQMPLDYMICMVMCMNGVKIGVEIIYRGRSPTQRAH
jgi:hypothetical protein